MLLLKWYDYLYRPCFYYTYDSRKVSPFLAFETFSRWPLPRGKSDENLPLWFFFSYLNNLKNVCGFTTQGGFSEEGNSFSVCRISENYGRGVYVFRLGTYAVRFLEALCSLSAVCLAPRSWSQMEAGFLWVSEQKPFQLFFLSSEFCFYFNENLKTHKAIQNENMCSNKLESEDENTSSGGGIAASSLVLCCWGFNGQRLKVWGSPYI